jgi:hypothetical protein
MTYHSTNMKCVRPTISEELYSQSEVGRMNEQTTVSSICPYTSVGNQLGKSKQLTEIIGCLTQIPFSIIIGMCCM